MGCCTSAESDAPDGIVSLTKPGKRTQYKIILLGNAGVGKSSVWQRFINGTFSELSEPTLTSEPAKKTIDMNGVSIPLEVWDSVGIDKHRTSTANDPIYRRVDGCIMCFDVSNAQTLESINQWKSELATNYKGQHPPLCMILGLKADLPPTVSPDQIQQISQNLDMEYATCSSKLDQGVTEAFAKFGAAVKQQRDQEESGQLV